MEKIPEIQIEIQNRMDDFIKLAKLNTEEAWEKIDEQLPRYCNNPVILNWAKENLANLESGLADLSATVLEATDEKLNDKDTANLILLMHRDYADNPYPSFRAACALAKHINDVLLAESVVLEIRNKLKIFLEDKDVSDIAQSYIDSLS